MIGSRPQVLYLGIFQIYIYVGLISKQIYTILFPGITISVSIFKTAIPSTIHGDNYFVYILDK